MAAELLAGLGAVKTAFDIAKGLKNIDDAARRNAAVIELQEQILSAQQAQAALIERIGDLEKEVARFETWETEKQRYKLTDYGSGTFARELKPEAANGEPPHKICAGCYDKGVKSVLQFSHRGGGDQRLNFDCHSCGKRVALGTPQPRAQNPTMRSDYF